jgi:hypothetical protein
MPQRASANQRRSPSRASSKYDYTEISKVELSSADKVNFYGVIIDATFPYQFIQSKTNEKLFMCVLKVVDPSHYAKGEFAQLIMYAYKFEDLPIVQRLGDIIRVHRATIRKYQSKNGSGHIRQFSANMYYSSSWALYSSDKTIPTGQAATEGPYAFSGKRSTHEKQDTAIQSTLKKWAQNHFAKINVEGGDRTRALNVAHK